MRLAFEDYSLQLDPSLVEEAVLLASEWASASDRLEFRRERDFLYEIAIVDIREASFRELDRRWFFRFGLAEPLLDLLKEAALGGKISRCLLVAARGPGKEGADLHDDERPGEEKPVLVIRLRPRTIVNRERLGILLRRELLHVSDILDPAFGYRREPPAFGGDPQRERRFLERYRILWDLSVDGRLLAEGKLAPEVEAQRRREFLSAFSMAAEDAEETFRRLFHGERPGHEQLVELALRAGESAAAFCPLCRLPSGRLFEGDLETEVADAIRKDFPAWSPAAKLCVACVELYRARRPRTRTAFSA